MYLKRLDISGFKTFAAKTEVEFTPGFMGVVGPNGSGKSNLTDAIRYCLGEQSAKVLRATRQEELIFAGTPQRNAAPGCSVTATFDNSDGSFPLDFAEVAITRRTTRDGDSQYFINRTACRQRDIHELLMGSGIGPGSFSVLGGKEINNVLSSDPSERRMMLEETAGTNRYRFRKKEALRKLTQTKQNLVRLNDILVEVDRNVEESAKALERYKKYKAAQDELKELEYNLACSELHELGQKVESCQSSTEQARQESERADAAEQQLTAKLTDLESVHQGVLSQIEALQSELLDHNSELAASKASFDGLFDQATQCEITAKAASQRLQNAAQRLQERQQALDAVQASLPTLQEDLQQAQLRLQESRRLLEECPGASQTELISARNNITRLEDKLRKLESQRAGQKARAEQDELRLQSLRQDIERIAHELPEVEDNSDDIASLQETIAAAKEQQDELAQRKEALKATMTQLRREGEQAEQMRLQYNRKVQEYEGSVNQRFGMPEAQRAVLNWHDDDVVGAIGELITVKKGLETAMEAALGGRLFDIVTTERQATTRLVERLKRERLGRVTFWPLDLVQHDNRRLEVTRVSGWIGWALDLIEFSPELKPVLSQMIGNTVVMQDMHSAYQLYDHCGGRRPHVVTLAGEYLSPAGSLTGGTLKTDRAGLLKRKRLLEENIDLRAQQDAILQKCAQRFQQLQAEYRQTETDLEKSVQTTREARTKLADMEAENRRLQRDREQVQRNIERLEKERQDIDQRAEDFSSAAKSLEESLQSLETELTQAQGKLADVQQRETERTIEREKLRQQVAQCELNSAENQRKLEERKREIESLRGRQREIEEDSALARHELDEAEKTRQDLGNKGQELQKRIGELEGSLQGENAKLNEYRQQSEQSQGIIQQCRAEREQAAKEARRLGESFHRQLSELETLQASLDEVQEKLQEHHGNSLQPDLSNFDIEKSKAQSRRLQSFLANFGGVNMGAVDDYERYSKRQQELRTNITDLESASESLETIIAEMDKASISRFKAAFEAVNQTFGHIFKEIFQGGWAKLELTDPEDLLDSGVDIVACPPGKKLQNLMLFSSGERTLAASAFLLALLTHKPSPIVVFDELDAPLDDSNVEKIARRLRDFSKSSQFLVITHNRKTMEYADRLYGVTMEEPGVSRLLSVELRDIDSDNLTGETAGATGKGPYLGAVPDKQGAHAPRLGKATNASSLAVAEINR